MPSKAARRAGVWNASVCSATTRRTSPASSLRMGRTVKAPQGEVYRRPASALATPLLVLVLPPLPLPLLVLVSASACCWLLVAGGGRRRR